MNTSRIVNNLLLFFGFLFVIFPSFVKGLESTRNGWTTLDYISNGEKVHLEMPFDSQVVNEGPLIAVVGIIGSDQFSIWTTNPPRSDLDVDQATSMVTAIIQKNGGYVRETKKSKINGQWFVDIDGGNSHHILLLKGRIILTPKNIYYLEALSSNGNNLFSEFFHQCWIK
jgi:hypothetical protein